MIGQSPQEVFGKLEGGAGPLTGQFLGGGSASRKARGRVVHGPVIFSSSTIGRVIKYVSGKWKAGKGHGWVISKQQLRWLVIIKRGFGKVEQGPGPLTGWFYCRTCFRKAEAGARPVDWSLYIEKEGRRGREGR